MRYEFCHTFIEKLLVTRVKRFEHYNIILISLRNSAANKPHGQWYYDVTFSEQIIIYAIEHGTSSTPGPEYLFYLWSVLR